MDATGNFRGALYMAIAMAAFTCNDALVKSLASELNTGQIMFVRGLVTTLLVAAIAWRTRAIGSLGVMLQPAVALRMAAEIGASVTYISALGAMPIANTSAILQALPLAVTLGAALFLSEPVGWRRWLAILAGFVGVMIVIRPGPEGFSTAAGYVVASVVCAAIRDLCTRRIDLAVPALTITATTAASITVVGGLLIVPMGGWQPMGGSLIVQIVLASSLLLVGYQCIVLAMRTGEISFVAPFRYTGLIWAIAIGIFVFGDIPDAWMCLGIAIIVGSGLYAFYRESNRKGPAYAKESVAETP
ncbi:DMT family transporter [Sinorhizobium sp. BG8]|uniref:DMT family transporter n=1 Tax=Sinorhizobium sp. BG8 TaxID=2613773 RepID=UPI00193DC253|nr:DMT family transporter [Sinorhizobium sp. BG8]QRM55699.1 DMT family transporter [Sinorhizobium sp. BG8]